MAVIALCTWVNVSSNPSFILFLAISGRLEEHLRSGSLSFSEQSSDRSRASSDAETPVETGRVSS